MGGDSKPQNPGMLLSSLLVVVDWDGNQGDLSHTSILYYWEIPNQKLKTFPPLTKIK
jgi:hypothetical protein